MSDMTPSDPAPEPPLPPEIRFLKILVTALTVTMILGLVAIVGLLVIRLRAAPPVLPELPAAITLPEGTRAVSLSFAEGAGGGRIVVLTADHRVLVYTPAGALLGDLPLTAP